LVEQLSLIATGGLEPDLTFFLDLDPNLVYGRTNVLRDHGGRREQPSRFDRESEEFHQRLRAAFLALAQAHAERVKIIDASQAPQEVHRQIVSLVQPLIEEMKFHM
jgi:dTMP kinase